MAVFNVGALRKAKGLEDPKREILISSGDIDGDLEKAKEMTQDILEANGDPVLDLEKLEKLKSKKEVIEYGQELGINVPSTLKLVEMKEIVSGEAK